jgi:hypothetical protein
MTKPEWDTADISVKLEMLRKSIDDISTPYRRRSRDHMALLERLNDLEEDLESLRMTPAADIIRRQRAFSPPE